MRAAAATRRMAMVLAAGMLAAGACGPAAAQAAGERWRFDVSPYLMGASMDGTTAVRGLEADVDVPASDIFDNLEFGFMGAVIARKGDWGLGGDVIYMALGATTHEVDVDFNQGAFAAFGLRRLGAAADLTFGLRVNTLSGELGFKRLGTSRDQSKTWVDPLVGILLRTPDGRRVAFRLYAEIGGFGVGSKFGWQAFPVVLFRVSEKVSLDVGYRWLDLDYEDGDGTDLFVYDMLTQGPVAGVTFTF